jgi:NAD+ kinase
MGPAQGPSIAAELGASLEARGVQVCFDAVTAQALGRGGGPPRDALPPDVDLAIGVGGDGTLLSLARIAAPRRVPILGINFGSLGFLAELQPDELFAGLEALVEGRYTIEERQTLRVRCSGRVEHDYAVLNDAVITKGALARMITIGVSVDGAEVAAYTSDGLIVATPTGSTAYNLSAGGPILDPRMQAFVISPICPHTMTCRPLVVPGDVRIEAALKSGGEEVFVTLDGQVGFPFSGHDRLAIDAYPHPVRLVRVAGRGFFEILRRKLRWAER